MKFLIMDNYDSFTYNLKALIRSSLPGAVLEVRRNRDRAIMTSNFDALVISPGPMTWKETGILGELFAEKIIPEKLPVLGICLGMQFLAGFYGSEVSVIENPSHGLTTTVLHNSDPLFYGIPASFKAARYNSLGLYPSENAFLDFTAFEKDTGAVMALRHNLLPFAGVQFHPESFLSEYGAELISNFRKIYVQDMS